MKCLEKMALLWGAFVLCVTLSASAQSVLSNETREVSGLSGKSIELEGYSELHITGSGVPLTGCTVDMTDVDSWVFIHQHVPSVILSSYLSQFRVNGSVAVDGSNVRVVQYGQGTVIIPHPSGFQPLEVFDGPGFLGDSVSLSPNTAYGVVLGGNVQSFVLKRGYTATLASAANGTGGINYVAADGDLKIAALPDGLSGTVNFIRIYPWHWVAKKGTCDHDPAAFNAKWHYNWNVTWQAANANYEYVAIRQQRWWPGLPNPGDAGYLGVNHVSGYNEPDNSVEDAYTSLNNGDVATAVAAWPDLEWTGMRVGAPAVTDGGYGWIVDFINQAEAAGRRVDYIPIHYYRASNNNASSAASALRSFLKSIYDVVHKPIWVTEFNNGANWVNYQGDYDYYDPTFQQNSDCIEAMVDMMDDTPWIERYSIYGAVEECRELIDWSGNTTIMGAMYRDHESPIAYQQIIPAEGVAAAARYDFENNLDDMSGSGNHAVSHNYPDYVAGHGGGTALQFDGVDDHVILPDSLSRSSDFTFAGWVKWDGGSNWQRIFDFGIIDSGNRYMFLTPSDGSSMKFVINRGLGEAALTTGALSVGTWTHVAVTLSGDTGRLYVNGSQVDTISVAPDPEDLGAVQHYLGRSMFPNDPNFAGTLDDLLFVDDALSATQIAALAAGNQAPVAVSSSVDGGSVEAGSVYSSSVAGAATDPESGAITYRRVYGPGWVSVAADGTVSGTPGYKDAGMQIVIVRATDEAGQSISLTFEVEVTVPPYNFDNGPIAYWDFSDPGAADGAYLSGNGERADLDGDGSMDTDDFRVGSRDLSGNGNHLTAWTSSWMKWSSDSSLGGFSMVNGGNYPAAGTDSTYNPEIQATGYTRIDAEDVSPSVWTLEAMFKPSALSGTQTIVGRDGNTGENRAALYFSAVGTDLAISFRDGYGDWHVLQEAVGLTDDTWYRAAAASDGTTLRLYLDGSQVGSLDLSSSADSSLAVGYGTWTVSRGMFEGSSYDTGHTDRFFGAVDAVALSGVTLAPGSFLLEPDTTAPAAPTGLSTSIGALGIHLDWADNTEFDHCAYTVYRSTTSGSGYSPVASGVMSSEYTDGTAVSGIRYYYVVAATDLQGNESSVSSEVSESVVYTAIALTNSDFDQCIQESYPGGFDDTYNVPGWMDVSTTDAGVENAAWWVPYEGYSAFMASGDAAYLLSSYTIQAGDEFSVEFMAKGWATYANTPGAEWTVKLFYGSNPAVNVIGSYNTGTLHQEDSVEGWSAFSTAIAATSNSVGSTLGIVFENTGASGSYANLDEVFMNVVSIPEPDVPANVSALSGDGQITLSWDASANATGYQVMRALSGGGAYALVASPSATHSVDAGLTNGVEYFYVVNAVGAGGTSDNSGEVSAIPSAAIAVSEYAFAGHALSAGTNLTLSVNDTVPGHVYRLLATDSLTVTNWVEVVSGVGGSNLQFSVLIAPNSTNRFFKLDVERQ